MKRIRLNDIEKTSNDEYALNPIEKYVINIDEEMEF